MDEKKPFPFDPFADSLLGEKVLIAWLSLGKSETDLKTSLESNLNSKEFYFTPNAVKQTVMVRFPEQVRILIGSKDSVGLNRLFSDIISGKASGLGKPALDVALELLEWLLTGFEEDQILSVLLSSVFGKEFDVSFVEKVRAEYVKELRG
ncbi:VanZ family protein [Leptospira idonii]|uniref:VanZ family protein n=1 Tax=Leptospira idonii TaxID=1193500 RepID=A0A4R9M1I6_9LEPT|nr:VanZ family protein [Leptospira idonii]TGN19695.1 VanZ family protein [Leptospira idonii]